MSTRKKNKQARAGRKSSRQSSVDHDRDSVQANLHSLLEAAEKNPEAVKPRLRLGEFYLFNNQEEQLLDTVAPLEKHYPFDDVADCRAHDRLLAFGNAHAGNLAEVDKVCRRGLDREPDALDYSFILCFVHLQLRELDQAIESGARYLSRYDAISNSDKSEHEYTLSRRYLSQMENFLGSAHLERGESVEAEKYFDRSRQADPGNYLPYVNLARLARQNDQLDTARKIIGEGVGRCRQVQELRMLAEQMKRKTTVSACMIVKDEEELLPGCLDSIRDWVDEIVIVDTGSSDRTVEIAQSYGARIFHQPWEGNFSKHRNYSIEQATKDWIIIIDADERFSENDVPPLMELMDSDRHQIISINVFNMYAESDHRVTSVNSVRFFRRVLDMRYKDIVHNRLVIPDGVPITRAPFCLEHLGYDLSREKMLAKLERTRALLEKQIEEKPDFAFAWFNLAQLLRGELFESLEEYAPQVLEAAHRAVELSRPDDPETRGIHLMSLDQLAWTYFYTEDYDRAEEYAREALRSKPDYLDPLMLLGNIYSRTGEYDRATEGYKNYLEVQARFDEHRELEPLVLYHSDSRATANYGLGLIAQFRGQPEQAKRYFKQALEDTPGYLDANLFLGRIYLAENNFLEAERFFKAQFETSRPSVHAALGLACIYQQQNQPDAAEKGYLRALELDPENPEVLIKSGRFFLEIDRTAEGLELLQKAAQLGESDEIVERELARLHFAAANYDQAIEFYQKLLKRAPDDPEILNDLGNCYFKKLDHGEAESCYRRAIDTGLADSFVHRNRGLNQMRQARADEAIASFEESLKLNSQQQDILQLLADLHFQQQNFTAALGFYEKALGLDPTNAVALYSLSECYRVMGHGDAAALGYRRVLQLNPGFEAARQKIALLEQPVAGD